MDCRFDRHPAVRRFGADSRTVLPVRFLSHELVKSKEDKRALNRSEEVAITVEVMIWKLKLAVRKVRKCGARLSDLVHRRLYTADLKDAKALLDKLGM